MIDKIKTKKTRVNLKADKTQLFDEKNFLVVKREELRTEIVTLNIVNVLVRRYQDPLLRPTRDKFKAKRSLSFDGLKKNFQRFFIRARYYQGFYQQSLSFDSDKIQNAIVNMVGDVSKWEEPLLRDFLKNNSDNQKKLIQCIFGRYKD